MLHEGCAQTAGAKFHRAAGIPERELCAVPGARTPLREVLKVL